MASQAHEEADSCAIRAQMEGAGSTLGGRAGGWDLAQSGGIGQG